MPVPFLLPALASTLPQLILGGSQLLESGQMKPERPEYEIPESEKRALNLAKSMASQTRLPGQSAIEGRLDLTTANTLAAIERMGYGGAGDINAASRAFGSQLEKETELGVNAATMNLQNKRNFQSALDRYAMFEDKKWQLNELDPYMQDAEAKAALYEGGIRNLTGGFKDISGGLTNMLLANTLFKTPEFNQTPDLGKMSFAPPKVDPNEVYDPIPQNNQVSQTTQQNQILGMSEFSILSPAIQKMISERYQPIMNTIQ